MRIQPLYLSDNTNNNKKSPAVQNQQPAFGRISSAYGEWILKSKRIRKASEWIYSKDRTNATKHFAVVGSLVTSFAYAYNTLKNKRLEKKNSNTLAINQTLNFVVPTILGYTLDKLISGHTKNWEYKFAARLEKAIASAGLTHEEHEIALQRATKQLKGVRTLAGIATFTFLYRYLAPVAITKPANRMGEWLGKKLDAKKENEIPEARMEVAKA